MLMADSNINKF